MMKFKSENYGVNCVINLCVCNNITTCRNCALIILATTEHESRVNVNLKGEII